jgi:hypothetical protein
MGWACDTYGVEQVPAGVLQGRLREIGHLADIGLVGFIILKLIFRNLGKVSTGFI